MPFPVPAFNDLYPAKGNKKGGGIKRYPPTQKKKGGEKEKLPLLGFTNFAEQKVWLCAKKQRGQV